MFVLSKLLTAITQPMFWCALWLGWALLLQRRTPQTARRMLWIGYAAIGVLGFQALPDALLRKLENRFAAPPASVVAQAAGVLVLGGATDHPRIWLAHGQIGLGSAAERMTVPVGLMHQHPQLQLVFSGGEGRLLQTGITEGQLAQQFYQEQGVDMARVVIEQGSRTTRENALRVAETLGTRCANASWLLVTSAWHMARAVPEFEAAGCRIVPYPVDFRTGDTTAWTDYHFADSLMRWQTALHEYLGMLAYALTR